MRRTFAIILTATACTPEGGDTAGSAAESTAATTSEDATGTGAGSTTTLDPGTTTGAATTGEPTTGTSSTGEPVDYCHGFQVEGDAPFLTMYALGGGELVDGTVWPLECGAQGLWMFGLYPSLGGWDPMADTVTLMVEVDVEGYNTNPAGHFFSGEVYYYIGCEDVLGGVLGVAPVLPPDDLADLAVLDGLPAQVRASVVADGVDLTVDVTVTLSAPGDLVLMGCGFGP